MALPCMSVGDGFEFNNVRAEHKTSCVLRSFAEDECFVTRICWLLKKIEATQV